MMGCPGSRTNGEGAWSLGCRNDSRLLHVHTARGGAKDIVQEYLSDLNPVFLEF